MVSFSSWGFLQAEGLIEKLDGGRAKRGGDMRIGVSEGGEDLLCDVAVC